MNDSDMRQAFDDVAWKRTRDELREQLADAEHASWARWMTYVFQVSVENPDGSVTLSPENAARWRRQANTRYHDLSEREKESDRKEVALIIPVIEEACWEWGRQIARWQVRQVTS